MDKVEILENGNIKITIPMVFRCRAGRKRIVTEDSDATLIDPVIINIARAFRWQALIDKGKFANVHELARAIGKDEEYVSRIIRLTLLAPEIIHAILTGNLNLKVGRKLICYVVILNLPPDVISVNSPAVTGHVYWRCIRNLQTNVTGIF